MSKRRSARPYSTVEPTSAPPIQTFERLSLGSEKNSEMYRRECEARTVLRWPLAKRREHIAAVQQKRGPTAAAMLKADIELLWKLSRGENDTA